MPQPTPTHARFYIGATTGVGLVLLAYSLGWAPSFPDLPRFLAYLVLACLASTLKVRLPKIQGTISPNFLFILIGLTQLSYSETLALGCLATVIQCIWRPKKRPAPIQVLFNVSTLIITISLAYTVTHLLTFSSLTVLLALAACVAFISNTVLVSAVLALLNRESVLRTWRQCYLWTFPYYLVGAIVAGLICLASNSVGWVPSLLILPAMYLVYLYYRFYLVERSESTVMVRS